VNIPTFIDVMFVKPDGYLTPEMQLFHDQINQTFQNGLSDNGWTVPQITAANLVLIAPDMPNGTCWYETDNHQVVFKINGALRKVTTTVYP
jgi:hypothetical protein